MGCLRGFLGEDSWAWLRSWESVRLSFLASRPLESIGNSPHPSVEMLERSLLVLAVMSCSSNASLWDFASVRSLCLGDSVGMVMEVGAR